MAIVAYQFDWRVVIDHWPAFLRGAWVDVWVTAVSFAIACLLGVVLAAGALSRRRALRGLTNAYVQVVRGIPLYIFLLWVYFGIAQVLGLLLTPFQAVIASLALTGSGYTAEIFRSGLQAVDSGQREAAVSLGANGLTVFTRVELPQALRIAIPPLGNTFIGMLKGATIISVIAVPDMVMEALNIDVVDFKPFEAFTAVAVILLVMVALLSIAIAALERALRIP